MHQTKPLVRFKLTLWNLSQAYGDTIIVSRTNTSENDTDDLNLKISKEEFATPLINGTNLFINRLTCKQFISTGINSLDAILRDGIPIGFITEICGLAGCGKSQLCMQLAINCVQNSSTSVLCIDTKGDFSAVRIQKILDSCGFSYKDMASIMLKIKVIHIWQMEDLVKLFEELKSGVLVIENLSLIIIDSLPSLMFQHFGDDNKIGLKLLNYFANYARSISKKMEIAIVCVNIQTRWIDQDVLDLEDEARSGEATYTEKWNRCLGKYWQNIPLIVLFLEKHQNSNENKCFTIKITVVGYNNPYINKNCMLEVSSCGIR
nr:DNA repair protein RAD51 homolog 4 [Maniola hyperantus]